MSAYTIGQSITSDAGRTGRVSSIREGWIWVRWYRIDGDRAPEVPWRRI